MCGEHSLMLTTFDVTCVCHHVYVTVFFFCFFFNYFSIKRRNPTGRQQQAALPRHNDLSHPLVKLFFFFCNYCCYHICQGHTGDKGFSCYYQHKGASAIEYVIKIEENSGKDKKKRNRYADVLADNSNRDICDCVQHKCLLHREPKRNQKVNLRLPSNMLHSSSLFFLFYFLPCTSLI